MRNLLETIAVVTGASRGIGSAIALALARRGATVTLAVRRSSSAEEVSAAIAAAGGTSSIVECDVTSAHAVENLMAKVVEQYGRIDILVNNAGTIQPIGLLADVDPAVWKTGIDVNLVGTFNCIRYSLPNMLERGAGVIINLSTGAARTPFDGWSSYCSAKAGLAMLTRVVHEEYRSRGIRALGFLPGVVDTDMHVAIRASGINRVSQLPRSSLSSIDEPGHAAAWLCTADATEWAGQEVDVRDARFRAAAGLPPRPG